MKKILSIVCLLLVCALLLCACDTNGAGAQGPKGDTGAAVEKVELDDQGRLVITLTDGTVLDPVEMPEKDEHTHRFGEWDYFYGDELLGEDVLFRVCLTCRKLELKLDMEEQEPEDPEEPEESGKPGKSDTTIKIGLSGPLTGQAAVYGVGVANAAQMAVDEINAMGGLNGVLLELRALDDKHDNTRVANNYAQLMDWGMQVSLGCVTTMPCLEFARLSNMDNLFFLTPSASANAIVTESQNGYQMCFADTVQGKAAAEYVNTLNLSKIGVFYKSDDDYSKGNYDEFKAYLNANITVVEASFTHQTDADFSVQVEVLKDCEFIFMPIYYTPAALFMIQAKDIVAKDAVYCGCDGFDGIDTCVEGFDITTIPQRIGMLSDFNVHATEGVAKEFIDRYSAKYGRDTLNQHGAAAYDCVYAIYGAMKAAVRAGEEIDATTTASEMCEILKAQFNGGYTYTGAVTGTGTVRWTSDGFVNKEAWLYFLK